MSLHPSPYIHLPSGKHTHTIILLHGTSQTGLSFASSFLDFPFSLTPPTSPFSPPHHPPTSKVTTLRALLEKGGELEGLRVIFPTGSPKRMTVFDGKEFNAWFDIHSFSDRTIGEEGQVVGMRESLVYLKDLVKREREILDLRIDAGKIEDGEESQGKRRGKVILGGFSQGTAIGIIGLLSGELEVDAFVGMSGWLPFRKQAWEVLGKFIQNSTSPRESQGCLRWMRRVLLTFLRRISWVVYFLFGKWLSRRLYTDEEQEMIERRAAVLRYYRTLLSLPKANGKVINPEIPTLINHGKEDVKVKLEWSEQMREVMRELGWNMREREYEGVEHWYCEEGMRDFVGLLTEACRKA